MSQLSQVFPWKPSLPSSKKRDPGKPSARLDRFRVAILGPIYLGSKVKQHHPQGQKLNKWEDLKQTLTQSQSRSCTKPGEVDLWQQEGSFRGTQSMPTPPAPHSTPGSSLQDGAAAAAPPAVLPALAVLIPVHSGAVCVSRVVHSVKQQGAFSSSSIHPGASVIPRQPLTRARLLPV